MSSTFLHWIAIYNSPIAWSQAQDAKGGGLCAGLATLPSKKLHATETLTDEQDAGWRIKASQETGPMTDDSQTRKGQKGHLESEHAPTKNNA